MSLFRSFDISASGLTAQRLRMDTIANNIANVNTTRTESGGPYRRQMPVFAERLQAQMARVKGPTHRGQAIGLGVRVVGLIEDNDSPRLVYDPGHPDADEHGYVAYPNVNTVTEMVDLIGASRAYEANLVALVTARDMALKALEIGRA